jgi:hypothetical protein
MSEKRQVELDRDELRFIEALRNADEAAMISVFADVNGLKDLNPPPAAASDPLTDVSDIPRDKPSKTDNISFEKPARELDTDLATTTLTFIEAWKAGNIEGLQRLVDEKRGQPLPASHVARERTRARQLAPDIRFRMLGVLEEMQTLLDDTACRISRARPNGNIAGIFEEDAIATEILHGLSDYLSVYPNANQVSSEYHVYRHFDLDYNYTEKALRALDPAGKVQAVEDYGDDE